MMELGLFSLLDKQRLDAEEIAQKLQIPNRRCNYWLQILQSTGLIEAGEGGYDLSTVARTAILDSYSLSTWSYLAVEARERIPAVKDLANQICEPGSTWEAQGLTPPNYVEEMIKSPARAERFTRMLYEIHQPLAEEIANALDVEEVEQLLDLGGGSGVVSMALLRHNPNLRATILDIPNVCAVGRQIAKENSMEERLTHLETDLLKDELPSGFDVILQCDVGLQDDAYLGKIWSALKLGGRLVVVDQFESEKGVVPRQWLYRAFLASMGNPKYEFGTSVELAVSLRKVGFQILREITLPGRKSLTWDYGWVLIEAAKVEDAR